MYLDVPFFFFPPHIFYALYSLLELFFELFRCQDKLLRAVSVWVCVSVCVCVCVCECESVCV